MTDNSPGYTVDRLAEFVVNADQSDISGDARATLKRNVLDSIACAIGALDGELIPRSAHTPNSSAAARPRLSSAADARRWIRPPSSTRCWCAIPIYSIPI